MVIGVLKEIKPNEYRVAAVPATVHEIVRHGHEVYVESGAGIGSGYSDDDYARTGRNIDCRDNLILSCGYTAMAFCRDRA